MEISLSEMKRYILNTGEYTEDEVKDMDIGEIYDLYEMYHED